MSLLMALNLPPLPDRGARPALATGAADARTGLPAPKTSRLSEAADSWRVTHGRADERIAALKASVKTHYAEEHPELFGHIERSLDKLDVVLVKIDQRLADSLAHAGKAADDNARKAELNQAKALLAEYITYVKSEPLVAHIDRNPFGIKTDLRALLAAGLTEAANAIGR